MRIGKANALAGKAVYIGCFHVSRAITLQVAIPQVVGVNDNHVWAARVVGPTVLHLLGVCAYGRKQCRRK